MFLTSIFKVKAQLNTLFLFRGPQWGILQGSRVNIIIIYCLTSDSDPYWAHADYFLYICGEKTLLRKPRNLSPCLLGLAYKAPTSHLQCSTTLLFNLLRNHCCRNKPTDALVSQTLLYYCRVIRGRLLLAPLPSITISFTT